jgi:hypothetical protein
LQRSRSKNGELKRIRLGRGAHLRTPGQLPRFRLQDNDANPNTKTDGMKVPFCLPTKRITCGKACCDIYQGSGRI